MCSSHVFLTVPDSPLPLSPNYFKDGDPPPPPVIGSSIAMTFLWHTMLKYRTSVIPSFHKGKFFDIGV